jgi:hypothetical protein
VIKAGRRKLSRKKNGKGLPLSAKPPVHIPVSARSRAGGPGMPLKVGHFLAAGIALQRLIET